MRDKILCKASEMFINLGFKSVTMDDIANDLAISKKTLYKYFSNKTELVEESTESFHNSCLGIINHIMEQGYNPIRENFEIKKMFKEMFKNASSSPVYQLKKYYPEIHTKLKKKEIVIFSECIKSNILRGIEQGYYREDINVDLYTEFYFSLVFGIHENGDNIASIPELEKEALEYHTRALATDKGKIELELQLNTNYN